jgi:hypothetical protein
MAAKKSIYIWIILVIAVWLLGSVTQAWAQTYTLKCRETGYLSKVNAIEVGDVPDHILLVVELAGVCSCDDGSVGTISQKGMSELTKGSGKAHGYELITYEDGSAQWYKFQMTITPDPSGKTASWEGTMEYIKGTGRFEGIQGNGSYIGKRLASVPGAGAQYYFDSTVTYTLPSK